MPPTTDRRDFLRRVARNTIYAAPVVRALASPDRLLAQQNQNSQKGGMGKGMTMDKGNSAVAMGKGMSVLGIDPPWSR